MESIDSRGAVRITHIFRTITRGVQVRAEMDRGRLAPSPRRGARDATAFAAKVHVS